MKEEVEIPNKKSQEKLKEAILSHAGEGVLNFISEQVLLSTDRTILLTYKNDTGGYDISNTDSLQIRTIIDLGVVNYKNNLNSYFKLVNGSLPDAGMYIGCAETIIERKDRLRAKYPQALFKLIWLFDFLINRVLSRIVLAKSIYSLFAQDKYYVISKAEILGRLSHAGFEIIDTKVINNLLFFSVLKTREPLSDKEVPVGLLIKMQRIGKGGKTVGIYKVRTMHPYSQYIQDYVVKMNGYNEVGKPNGDFRITGWSKYLRKLHLDELPQLYNLLIGDLAMVGVRPLTGFGYQSLPKDLQGERIKYKPGCIPPNVALGLKGFEGVIKAERIYLEERSKHGLIVNFKYFWMAVYNMIYKRNLSA
jgi:lipopolysaccharide/colanic/teichoic acid biosynthesis glycosyltransferase